MEEMVDYTNETQFGKNVFSETECIEKHYYYCWDGKFKYASLWMKSFPESGFDVDNLAEFLIGNKFDEGDLIFWSVNHPMKMPFPDALWVKRTGWVDKVNEVISDAKSKGWSAKEISDGYHTFQELYDFRLTYNALLFNGWAEDYYNGIESDEMLIEEGMRPLLGEQRTSENTSPRFNVHKSWKHNDGEWCFGEEKKWFIVSAMIPGGLISNHYKAEHWDKFKVPEVEKALFEFDGHEGSDVLKRLNQLL